MSSIVNIKVATTLSLILSIYGNFKYALGRSPVERDPDDDPFFRVGFTPFTANILIVFIYWGFLHLLQILFVSKYFWNDTQEVAEGAASTKADTTKIGWHFSLFNILQFVWIVLFSHGHYILSELVAILNFINLILFYFTQKTYSISDFVDYIFIHLSTNSLPFSWSLYVLFWNGAVVVGSNSLAARIVANIFIWDFLLVPGFLLVIYRDWGVGFSSAAITLALALGQLFTRLFALQWIFAFIISGLLFLSSLAVLSANLSNKRAGAETDAETAPLIQ